MLTEGASIAIFGHLKKRLQFIESKNPPFYLIHKNVDAIHRGFSQTANFIAHRIVVVFVGCRRQRAD